MLDHLLLPENGPADLGLDGVELAMGFLQVEVSHGGSWAWASGVGPDGLYGPEGGEEAADIPRGRRAEQGGLGHLR